MSCRPLLALAALILLSSACDSSSAPPSPPALSRVQQGERDHQGTQLQGGSGENAFVVLPGAGTPTSMLPRTRDGRTFDSVQVEYASLKGTTGGVTLYGTDFAGTTFFGQDTRTGHALTFKVSGVTEVSPGQFEYDVAVSDAGAPAVPLCAAGSRATPVPGAWDAYGAFTGSSQFTFACPDGVVSKCIRWGYRFWEPGMLNYHQACTRMARADYCGVGQSHTVDGTSIDHYDLPGMEGVPGFIARDPTTTGMAFEAAWPAKGPAVCLSKLRWSTLPLGGYCPLTLPDPRIVSVQKDPRARFCEDYGKGDLLSMLQELQASGAYTFNDSAFIDSGLYRWRHGVTFESLTTIDGFWAPARPEARPPVSGYGSAVFEGAVFNLGADPALLPSGALALTRYFSASRGEYMTTTSTPAAIFGTSTDYVRQAVEGFIYPPSTPASALPGGARQLSLYYNVSTGDFVTTTAALAWPNWRLRTEGYLPR